MGSAHASKRLLLGPTRILRAITTVHTVVSATGVVAIRPMSTYTTVAFGVPHILAEVPSDAARMNLCFSRDLPARNASG